MRSSLLSSLRALAASSSLSLGSPAAAGLCTALRLPSLAAATSASCSAPAAPLLGARPFSSGGGSGGSGGGGGGGGSDGSGGSSSSDSGPTSQQLMHIWMHATPTAGFDVVMQPATSSKGQRRGAAGPGLQAWLHATWASFQLALWSESNVQGEVRQLLAKSQNLRQTGRGDEADALEQKELGKLADMPFGMQQQLPLLLEAGRYDLAVDTALAAYNKKVAKWGRSNEKAVLAGVPLGIALAAAHRHNEARPLLQDGMVLILPRVEALKTIKMAVVGLSKRGRWGTKTSHSLWKKLGLASTFYASCAMEASFYHGLSDVMEARWELERTWKSVGCKAEFKRRLDNTTKMIGALANEVGSQHLRVENALREYGRAVAMPQLKRQRQVRQALRSHAKELRDAVDKERQRKEAVAVLSLQLTRAAAAKQEQAVQEAVGKLMLQLRMP